MNVVQFILRNTIHPRGIYADAIRAEKYEKKKGKGIANEKGEKRLTVILK
jgi:hypothetical protein